MNNPKKYRDVKSVPDTLNMTYVPKIINSMSWNFVNGNILDYGCGPGCTGFNSFLPKVKQTNSKMYSVDISEEMVAFAQSNFNHPNISYNVGSLPDHFPFENVKFDKIFAVNVFHFVSDIKSMLSAMKQILEPGGELGFTCATANCIVFKIWKQLVQTSLWAEYMQDYEKTWPTWTNYKNCEPENYFRKLLFTEPGFEEVHFQFPTVKVTKEANMIIDFLITVSPFSGKIPTHLHKRLKDDYKRLLNEVYGISVDGPTITLEYEYICAVLRCPEEKV